MLFEAPILSKYVYRFPAVNINWRRTQEKVEVIPKSIKK
jgi:hypothetical protein